MFRPIKSVVIELLENSNFHQKHNFITTNSLFFIIISHSNTRVIIWNFLHNYIIIYGEYSTEYNIIFFSWIYSIIIDILLLSRSLLTCELVSLLFRDSNGLLLYIENGIKISFIQSNDNDDDK